MIVRTSVKAGSIGGSGNHSQAVVVKTGVKAGSISGGNHAQAAVVVRTGVKAGSPGFNHAQTTVLPRPA
jgi:hypothetical protein